jgi:hypothetical protein
MSADSGKILESRDLAVGNEQQNVEGFGLADYVDGLVDDRSEIRRPAEFNTCSDTSDTPVVSISLTLRAISMPCQVSFRVYLGRSLGILTALRSSLCTAYLGKTESKTCRLCACHRTRTRV